MSRHGIEPNENGSEAITESPRPRPSRVIAEPITPRSDRHSTRDVRRTDPPKEAGLFQFGRSKRRIVDIVCARYPCTAAGL